MASRIRNKQVETCRNGIHQVEQRRLPGQEPELPRKGDEQHTEHQSKLDAWHVGSPHYWQTKSWCQVCYQASPNKMNAEQDCHGHTLTDPSRAGVLIHWSSPILSRHGMCSMSLPSSESAFLNWKTFDSVAAVDVFCLHHMLNLCWICVFQGKTTIKVWS